MKTIYFAGGCFWGLEKFFQNIKGVIKTKVGYANGNFENPSYEQVCTGNTNFAETVRINYDPNFINLKDLLNYFYKVIDPTSLNKQGEDVGTQYRTGIYYTDEKEKNIIYNSIKNLQLSFDKPIVIEYQFLNNFYEAEEYHQKYLDKNPNGYCHINLT